MIVKMLKVFVAGRGADRDRLLDALRNLGVVHLQPVDPPAAVADEGTLAGIDHLGRAVQILSAIEPAGDRPDLSGLQAAEELLEIHRKSVERRSRLAVLHRQIEQLEMWGDVRTERFEQLRSRGIDISFFSVLPEAVGAIEADCVQVLRELPDKRLLVAAVSRGGQTEVPEDAEPIEIPQRDRPSVRAEAAKIDAALAEAAKRESRLAHLVDQMRADRARLEREAEYAVARRGGLTEDRLFAIQGWAPAGLADGLPGNLAKAGIDAAVHTTEADPDEEPPTLIRHSRWVKPIKALFDVLGTIPGYREKDLSPFFMVALPVFTAMLIGDAGYGLIFGVVGLIFYGKIKAKAGAPAAHLVMVFALVTVAWGIATANVFGVTPATMAKGGNYLRADDKGGQQLDYEKMAHGADLYAAAGNAMIAVGPLWRSDAKAARDTIIKICFLLGCLHLVLAHLRSALDLAPDLRSLAQIGWCGFLVGMLGVIWAMFYKQEIWMPPRVMFGLLIGGAVLVVLFSYPSRNPAKTIGLGIIANLLPMISTFSDTISYIRLMAVGLASYYIASAFNGLAWQVGRISAWLIPACVLIVVFAHSLNIILGLIAIFAHGVRLNMLEFSSNAGVQWVGYPYAPFANAAAEGER